MTKGGRLRVAVPAALGELPRASGHGKVWGQLLDRLGARCQLELVARPQARRWRRPDVWLWDGHQGALDVPSPRVAQLFEAGWAEPDVRATLDAGFLAAIERQTADAVACADAIITLSASSRDQLVEQYGADCDRTHVVHLGVDHARFHPDVSGGPALVDAAGGDPHRPYVLFVSQLHPRKNLGALRQAMTERADAGAPHQLVVVGGAPADRAYAADLVTAARADLPGHPGSVVALEGVTDGQLAALMAGAAVFCLPSLMEGFGLTALEAMACGSPVVVSDRGSLPEVVGDGALVTAPTAGAVGRALATVLDDAGRADDLRRRGVARARGFTWDRTVDGWYAALLSACR
ncbi:glycosyltransferase family 1 protein [soil metagenome]